MGCALFLPGKDYFKISRMGRYLEIWDEDRFAATCAQSEMDIDALLNYVNDRYYSPQS